MLNGEQLLQEARGFLEQGLEVDAITNLLAKANKVTFEEMDEVLSITAGAEQGLPPEVVMVLKQARARIKEQLENGEEPDRVQFFEIPQP